MELDEARAVLIQGEGKKVRADGGVVEGALHDGRNGELRASRVLLRRGEGGREGGGEGRDKRRGGGRAVRQSTKGCIGC